MKIVKSDDNVILFISKDLINFNIFIKDEIENFIKKIVLKMKKRRFKISGFYKVKVYQNSNYGLIVEMKKEDELDFFPDLIDLKLVIFYDSEIYFKVSDYFLVERYDDKKRIGDYWYVNVNCLKNNDIYKLIEFSEVIYGEAKDRLLKYS